MRPYKGGLASQVVETKTHLLQYIGAEPLGFLAPRNMNEHAEIMRD